MDSFANEIYNKTLHILKDKQEYLSYIRAEQAELDKKGQLRYAKGQGEKIGEKRGEKRGIEIGKLEMAMKLKNEGIPLEIIAKTAEIPLSEVEEL